MDFLFVLTQLGATTFKALLKILSKKVLFCLRWFRYTNIIIKAFNGAC